MATNGWVADGAGALARSGAQVLVRAANLCFTDEFGLSSDLILVISAKHKTLFIELVSCNSSGTSFTRQALRTKTCPEVILWSHGAKFEITARKTSDFG